MTHRILHIEDDEFQRLLLIRSVGQTLDIVARGNIDQVTEDDIRSCDAAILDLGIEPYQGTEIIQVFIERCGEYRIPFIAYSGDDRIETQSACLEAGADAFISKSEIGSEKRIVNALIRAIGSSEAAKLTQQLNQLHCKLMQIVNS